MADAREKSQWWHTSYLVAIIRNSQCTKQSDLIQPWQIHPYLTSEEKAKYSGSTDHELSPEEAEALLKSLSGIKS